MLFGRSGGVDWLVVCLGNPGDQYENTRHNVGFRVADELAERKGIPIQRLKFRALTNTAELGGQRVLLMKPITYMNLSGEAAREAAAFYKVPPQRILVVSDDVALPVGRLRLRRSGSAGGHNGLKNLISQLGTDQFPRVRIGVGAKPHPDYDMADWVLGKFQSADKAAIDAAIPRAADAVEAVLRDGMDHAMNAFNSRS
ncbi:MAG: aminoacyl-tRNA hydrolase [Intestinimonas sp.]|jgi:PTH1 family peptidyl-tRNA hydrolase|nr:aminoacyl-tRNA hydrolase [Intestinimonas sp.]